MTPKANSICYHNTDELWRTKCAYSVYENKFYYAKSVSPIYACEQQNKFMGLLLDECQLKAEALEEPFKLTGNFYGANARKIPTTDYYIYFIPVHFHGHIYGGIDKIYAKQLVRSTHDLSLKKKKKTKNLNYYLTSLHRKKLKKNNELWETINKLFI